MASNWRDGVADLGLQGGTFFPGFVGPYPVLVARFLDGTGGVAKCIDLAGIAHAVYVLDRGGDRGWQLEFEIQGAEPPFPYGSAVFPDH